LKARLHLYRLFCRTDVTNIPGRSADLPSLPVGDHTPAGYQVPRDGWVEGAIKAPARRFGYPVYNFLVHRWLERKYGDLAPFPIDTWLWGQRGNDYATHRRRVNRVFPLVGRDVLIAGCGTGRDVFSWLRYHPATITGVDYLDYERAWRGFNDHARVSNPGVRVSFQQADLRSLDAVADQSVDVVASDAVFEHIRDLPAALREFHRVLRPGGIVYASFGPLWYTWHGDHVSGYDELRSGYNHLLLAPAEYESYIAGDTAHDGAFWREHDLFSYLRPAEYVETLQKAGFRRRYVGVVVSQEGVRCLHEYPQLAARLARVAPTFDLITLGMTIIYEKPGAVGCG
jgi:SAM-dependent methyltransferase